MAKKTASIVSLACASEQPSFAATLATKGLMLNARFGLLANYFSVYLLCYLCPVLREQIR